MWFISFYWHKFQTFGTSELQHSREASRRSGTWNEHCGMKRVWLVEKREEFKQVRAWTKHRGKNDHAECEEQHQNQSDKLGKSAAANSILAICQAKYVSDPPLKTTINNGFFPSSQIYWWACKKIRKIRRELSEDRKLTSLLLKGI